MIMIRPVIGYGVRAVPYNQSTLAETSDEMGSHKMGAIFTQHGSYSYITWEL